MVARYHLKALLQCCPYCALKTVNLFRNSQLDSHVNLKEIGQDGRLRANHFSVFRLKRKKKEKKKKERYKQILT